MELENLVNIKSFDKLQNVEIIEYLISKFQKYSKEILKVKNPDSDQKYNLLIGLNTTLNNINNAIILAGHMDTVIADESAYLTDPYKATLINNKIYGLGIIDMKCFFASIIDNIEIISNLKKPIIIAITCDEETDLYGINEIIAVMRKRNICPQLSIVGEPTKLAIATKSRSCLEYEISVSGKSCHSSNPQNGINAIYIISQLVLLIEELSKKYNNTTLNVGKIIGGERINTVPSLSSINFDIRSDNTLDPQKCIESINRKITLLKNKYPGCEIVLTNTLKIPPLQNNKRDIIEKIINKFELTEIEFSAGCEAGYFESLGGSAILLGAGDLNLAHKPNEFLELNDYKKYNRLFIEILKYIDNL